MAQKALNSSRMKERNYRRFFRELRLRPMTRAEVARQMGLTRAATSLIAEDMISTGIVQEGPMTYEGRYSSKAICWNKDFYHVAGINLGRDSVKVGVTDFCGKVIDSVSFPTWECENGAAVIDRASNLLSQIIERYKPAGSLLGIGLASPGPLDTKAGIILNPPHFEILWNCPVAPKFRDRFHCDIVLENDANSLALAERTYGFQDRFRNYLELLVDVGIGASLILDGKLHKGPAGFGNGLGHTSINIDGPKCDCGNNGCVEMYASITRIVEAAKKADPALVSWRAVVDAANMGMQAARDILNSEARYLAAAIVSASNLLDIEAVIFAGENVLYRPEMLLQAVEAQVNQRIAFRNERSIVILPSQIPDNAKVLSCTNLVIEKYMERPFVFSGSARYGHID